jgi:hypothetical protein
MKPYQLSETNITETLPPNEKFDAKLEGQSQSFHACEERGQSVDMNMYS